MHDHGQSLVVAVGGSYGWSSPFVVAVCWWWLGAVIVMCWWWWFGEKKPCHRL